MVQIRVSCVAQPSSWAWRVNSLGLCAEHKLLAIASFIIRYSDDKATPWEDGDAIEFHGLGSGVSTILTK